MKDLKVGIQLYSLRDELAKDMDSTLKRVKEMGYDYVEFAGFYDKSAEEIKALLDKHGLIAVSMHQSLDPYFSENACEFIKFVNTLGIKYSAVPWMDRAVFHDEARYADFVDKMRKAQKLLSANGIALCYHNHDFEFEKEGGEYVLDRLYNDIPELMTELDLCWVKYGGEVPVLCISRISTLSKWAAAPFTLSLTKTETKSRLKSPLRKTIALSLCLSDKEFRTLAPSLMQLRKATLNTLFTKRISGTTVTPLRTQE